MNFGPVPLFPSRFLCLTSPFYTSFRRRRHHQPQTARFEPALCRGSGLPCSTSFSTSFPDYLLSSKMSAPTLQGSFHFFFLGRSRFPSIFFFCARFILSPFPRTHPVHPQLRPPCFETFLRRRYLSSARSSFPLTVPSRSVFPAAAPYACVPMIHSKCARFFLLSWRRA